MTAVAVRVALPAHLRTLARLDNDEVRVAVRPPVTVDAILSALEAGFPMLRGTIRDHGTHRRRPFVRFFVGGADWSLGPTNRPLPLTVALGEEPFVILGAIAGG